MKNPRALFVSPVQPIGGCSANVYSWDKQPTRIRWHFSFLNHPGLCFLKANTPCEILEYPSQATFSAALANPPDVLGISFYINETETALRMVAEARRRGVKEVWAGNFGAYSPEVAQAFDRVFHGWGEAKVAETLRVSPTPSGQFVHPEMYGAVGMNVPPATVLAGLLFTSRGCPWTCNFCQTPSFYGKASPVPLEAIDRVVWTYRQRGVRIVNVLDENFGTFPQHAREVAELLHRHGMGWVALTRVDTLLKNFDVWQAKGLVGAHLGIESLNQLSLAGASKRIDQPESVRLLERMSQHHMFVQAFYILGFETDTAESIRHNVEQLARLDIDVVQVQVLTPYPRTEQRAEIERKYGIFDHNLSRYNSRHLVWNHPHITPDEMRLLQQWANAKLSSSWRALRTLAKFAFFFGKKRLNLRGLCLALGAPAGPAARLQRAFARPLAAMRRWSTSSWTPHEEVETEHSVTAGWRT